MIHRKRVTAICLMLLAMTRPARAQEVVAGSFDQLRMLARLGETLTITDTSGTTVTGKLAALSSSSLTLRVGKSRRDLVEGDVQTVVGHSHGSLGRGARWGFAIGAGIGLSSGLYWNSACVHCSSFASFVLPFTATYAALGAGLGVGIASVTPTRPVIYSSPDGARRKIAVSTLAAPGRRGAAFSVAF
jgi:hypothetical protein